jgi:hypothetical protein
VRDDDDEASLAARVLELEHALPQSVQWYCAGRLQSITARTLHRRWRASAARAPLTRNRPVAPGSNPNGLPATMPAVTAAPLRPPRSRRVLAIALVGSLAPHLR